MQTIRIDRVHSLIEVESSGFFTPDMAQAAGEEVRRAILSLGAAVGKHLTLYDFRDVDIAPALTVELLQATFANPANRPLWARKVAFCSPSALARMQIGRLRTSRPDIGIFADRDSALAWLLAPEPDAAPEVPVITISAGPA